MLSYLRNTFYVTLVELLNTPIIIDKVPCGENQAFIVVYVCAVLTNHVQIHSQHHC